MPTLPCHIRRVAAVVTACVVIQLSPAQAQDGERFDVVSVKQNIDGAGLITGGFCNGTDSSVAPTNITAVPNVAAPVGADRAPVSPGSCRFGKTTLKEIVAAAYAIPRRDFERLIVGGPSWIGSDRFDVEARTEKPRSQAQLERMLQTMLAERFGLRTHRETRQLDGYALTAVAGQSRLKAAEPDAPSRIRTEGRVSLTATATPMTRLAQLLTLQLGKPVADVTGLGGRYDFTLNWTAGPFEARPFGPLPVGQPPSPPAADSTGPSIFTALEEQLGLRLQPQRIPTDVLVIDAARHPLPN
ncbi:MAG: TIGR03435 family protein [Vicinamibacterales bacterium]